MVRFFVCSSAALLLVFLARGFAEDRSGAAGAPAAGADDLAQVKRVLAARLEYQSALEQLREHYRKQHDLERMRWAEEELIAYHRVSKKAFRLDLDVPPPTLKPQHNQAEANELYRRAMAYKGKGWMTEADDNMRRAELLLQQLLALYPQSDKIADVAYQLGEIYEHRSFRQYRRSVAYYERSFQWNPQSTTDARLRAARLYDRVLQDRGRAVQLYKEVISRDADPKRIEEARKRLAELSGGPPT